MEDPTGAVFCISQPKELQGFGLFDEPSAACWAGLTTPDITAAKRFYAEVFGWTISTDDYPHLKVKDGTGPSSVAFRT
jgi:hypothetical protein